MMVFPIWIELANVAAVQCSHDANPRKHRWAARRRDQDQGFHCSLPFRGRMLGLRKLRDVLAGILKGDELAPAWQRYWIIKSPLPAALSH
jgi:hypothetical protein